MMDIICIGKMKANSPEYELINGYLKQMKGTLQIIELESKNTDDASRKKTESDLLLSHIPKGAKVVVLDERGREMSSRDFSSKLNTWQDNGHNIVFLIGGADGHMDEVRAKADLVLSFGKMTLPHMLMRVVLVEQIYRARTIAAGHPYHRE